MAVTAHWIEPINHQGSPESPKKLCLRSDLVGFHQIPGRHTGEHLAHCFLFITDRLNITQKVSHSNFNFTTIINMFIRLDGSHVTMPQIMIQ